MNARVIVLQNEVVIPFLASHNRNRSPCSWRPIPGSARLRKIVCSSSGVCTASSFALSSLLADLGPIPGTLIKSRLNGDCVKSFLNIDYIFMFRKISIHTYMVALDTRDRPGSYNSFTICCPASLHLSHVLQPFISIINRPRERRRSSCWNTFFCEETRIQ